MNINVLVAEEKYSKLIAALWDMGRVVVAFSGGVDSTFLLYAAKQAVGARALAVTSRSGVVPRRDLAPTRKTPPPAAWTAWSAPLWRRRW